MVTRWELGRVPGSLFYKLKHMSKLTKYLESKTKVIKSNESGSKYYYFGRNLIRVSDHLSPLKDAEDLQIITSGNSNIIYIVSLHRKIYTFVHFREIKAFVDNWLLMVNHFDKMMDRTSNESVLKAEARLKEINESIKKAIAQRTNVQKDILADQEFTPAQINTIRSFIEQNTKNSKKAKKK